MDDFHSIRMFQEWIGRSFRVVGPSAMGISLTLVKVDVVQADDQFETFSLIFSGPANVFLPQAIYILDNGMPDTLDIFLVPVAETSSAYEYEAVFNRIKNND